MKRFIDHSGTFEIKVPTTWKHSIKNDKVHTFQEYEIWKSDAFQVSMNLLDTEDKQEKFLELSKSLPTEKIGDLTFNKFPDNGDEEFTTKSWIKQYDNKMVVFTLTYPNNPDKELDTRTTEEKINTVHSIIKEFKLIKTE